MPHISDTREINYVSFREKFLNSSIKSELLQFRKPVSGKGWQQEELSQDFAYLNQNSPVTLVHLSGVHGIEGYLGSRIQNKILSTFGTGFRDQKCNFIFAHAVNPYGMSWYRRVNENNIDLNRNGIDPQNLPVNPLFPRFREILNSSTRWEMLQKLPTVILDIYKDGFAESSQAIGGGQWQFPESIFFGGQKIQEEIRDLPELLLQMAPQTKKFIVLDVHTGLGPHAHDSLMVSLEEHLDFFRKATDEAGRKSHVYDTSPSAPGVLYKSVGSLEFWLRDRLKNQEILYLTQEFGTRFVLQVLLSLIEENSLYKSDPKNGGRPDIMLESFFPDSETWRRVCLGRGLQRFSQILAALPPG